LVIHVANQQNRVDCIEFAQNVGNRTSGSLGVGQTGLVAKVAACGDPQLPCSAGNRLPSQLALGWVFAHPFSLRFEQRCIEPRDLVKQNSIGELRRGVKVGRRFVNNY
jgi:hypothetical protein